MLKLLVVVSVDADFTVSVCSCHQGHETCQQCEYCFVLFKERHSWFNHLLHVLIFGWCSFSFVVLFRDEDMDRPIWQEVKKVMELSTWSSWWWNCSAMSAHRFRLYTALWSGTRVGSGASQEDICVLMKSVWPTCLTNCTMPFFLSFFMLMKIISLSSKNWHHRE